MGIEDWDGCEDWGWALGMGIGDGPWGWGGGVGDVHGASGMGILMGIRDWGWALGMGSGNGEWGWALGMGMGFRNSKRIQVFLQKCFRNCRETLQHEETQKKFECPPNRPFKDRAVSPPSHPSLGGLTARFRGGEVGKRSTSA